MEEENNYQPIYCEDDNEYRIHCDVCDIFCIVRFYKNHLKSQTHTNNINKKNLFQIFLLK